MKILRILLVVVLLLVIGLGAVFLYLRSSLMPQYQGEVTIPGLEQEVEVYYTEYGIPHIYATSVEDAYQALGYVHAQDRLFQMDLLRHVGSGTLSELFGKDLIKTDQYLRTLGIHDYARQSTEAYLQRNHPSLKETQAYVEGINDYLKHHPKTLEHQILGLEVAPFTVQNVFEILAYMSFSFQNAQRTDPVLTEILNKLDSTYLEDMNLYHYPGQTTLESYDARYSDMSANLTTKLEELNVPEFIGSNSWVLSAAKTETGAPIFANDPHIQFAQPCVWYEAHLVMPGREYYGYHIGGLPFPLLLHNTEMANGLTMLENDDMDFYTERLNPENEHQYWYRGAWNTIEEQKEVIRSSDSADVEFTIRSTAHGPIMSDILIPDHPLDEVVAMSWTYTREQNLNLDVLQELCSSRSMAQTESAVSKHHAPGLNYMYANANGDIAWWAMAKFQRRTNERNSKTFLRGDLDSTDIEYHPFEKNPKTINPPWGYVYTANNQPDTVDSVVYAGYYLPDDRAERIHEILESKERFTVDQAREIFLDDHSKLLQAVHPTLMAAIQPEDNPALYDALKSWQFSMNQNDFEPLIFQRWIYHILEGCQKDELGDALWEAYKKSHHYRVSIEHLIKKKGSKWWDNVHTSEIETRDAILAEAFQVAMDRLEEEWGKDYTQWKWGNAHFLEHKHAMGEALSFLNVGTFPSSGGSEVVNNMGYYYADSKLVPAFQGPSTRRIVDFSDVRNNSWSILPTGQSGNIFSPHYDDQAEMYARGEFRKMMMNEEEIKAAGQKLLIRPIAPN